MQKYTSANTSINCKRCPAIYGMKKAIEIMTGKFVIDIGGGKYDIAIEKAIEYNTNVSIYDKFNRTQEHNEKVLSTYYDVAIISNVLNVIKEKEEREKVLLLAKEKANTTLITVYEGNGSGVGKQTSTDSWQENRKTVDYIPEIIDIFDKVERYGKLIIAR